MNQHKLPLSLVHQRRVGHATQGEQREGLNQITRCIEDKFWKYSLKISEVEVNEPLQQKEYKITDMGSIKWTPSVIWKEGKD